MINYISTAFDFNNPQQATIEEAVNDIKNGKYKSIIESLRYIKESKGDEEYKSEKKRKLPAWTFNGTFKDSITNSNFNGSSGLFHFDIDGISDTKRLKKIISSMNTCVFCFVSPSGSGLKGAIKIDASIIKNDDDFKKAFIKVDDFFGSAEIKLDASCKDVRRLCFVSYDPDIYYNPNALVFPIDFKEDKKQQKKENTQQRKKTKTSSADTESIVIERIINTLSNATQGERHHKRLSVARFAGGCIAGGLINQQKAEDIIFQISDSIADNGVTLRTEVKTIYDGIEYGKNSPITDIFVEKKHDFNHEEKKIVTKKNIDDESTYHSVDLLKYIDDGHLMKRMAKHAAEMAQMPESSVFLMGLATFSSVACRKYCVSYQDGDKLPIGLYAVAEHPPGTGKTRSIKYFQSPFQKISEHCSKYAGIDEECNHKELPVLFISNATPEGIEVTLQGTKGFFSAVSSEQGLFNALLGGMYAGAKDGRQNNNDLMLSGFDFSYINSYRVGRTGYKGKVGGAIVCFAQEGSIESVLESSKGTGIAERFLMLSEPNSLGSRKFKDRPRRNESLLNEYNELCSHYDDVISVPIDVDNLECLIISDEGYDIIADYREKIEPHLKDGGKYSHGSMRGATGKIDIQIMKIAANLHISWNFDGLMISDDTVKVAIQVANALLAGALSVQMNKGLIGHKAEQGVILSMFEKNGNRPIVKTTITHYCRKVKPFKDSLKPIASVCDTIDKMVSANVLLMIEDEKRTISYRIL